MFNLDYGFLSWHVAAFLSHHLRFLISVVNEAFLDNLEFFFTHFYDNLYIVTFSFLKFFKTKYLVFMAWKQWSLWKSPLFPEFHHSFGVRQLYCICMC